MSYVVMVNRKSLNATAFQAECNRREGNGEELAAVFEKDGNTVAVFQSDSVRSQLLAEQKRTNQLLEWLGQRLSPAASDRYPQST